MCKRCGESVDHLLLHCPITYELRTMVFCLFGIHWVMLQRVVELLESQLGKFGRHLNITNLRFVPHCIMLCMWREQNARSFEGCKRSILEIKSFFFYTLLEWSLALLNYQLS